MSLINLFLVTPKGQTLSEPSQEKHTSEGNNERFAYAVSEMQGWRISMEDAHTTILELDDKHKDAFFAVFDGHGGSSIARYSGQHVHVRLAADEAYASKDYQAALKKAFLGTDDDLRTDPAFYHDPSGCTAVAALITSDGKIYCANAGDSRAVMSVKGEAEPLSFDHKPQNKAETQRITAAGGYVEFNRVNGNLALSRAIGDFEFKQNYALPPEEQIVTVNPDITVHDLTPEDEFLVIACDGIWDCMSSQDVINWTRHQISQKIPLSQICEDMMSRCLSPDSDIQGGIGCDNMTVMVIALLGERTLDEWYSWVAERVENQVGFNTPREYP
ncbi:protein phosphatase 2C 2, partial [Clavulina sp. PMI_390]